MLITGGAIAEYTARGSYLLLVLPADMAGRTWADSLRAVVRYTTLRQAGHFAYGYLKIGARRDIYVSGRFGDDGLPRDADPALYGVCIPVPADIAGALGRSTSHSTGDYSAEMAIRRWAVANHAMLSKAGRGLDKPIKARAIRCKLSRRGLSIRERYRLEYSEARRIARGRGKSPRTDRRHYEPCGWRHIELGKAERAMPGERKRRGHYRPGVDCVARPVDGAMYLRWLRNGMRRDVCIDGYRRAVEWARKMRIEWGPVPLP